MPLYEERKKKSQPNKNPINQTRKKNEINKSNKITNTIQEMTIEKRRNYFCEV